LFQLCLLYITQNVQHQNQDGVLENINIRECCLVIVCSIQKDLWEWTNFRKAWKCFSAVSMFEWSN